jgi:hypothetical protein
MVPKRWFLTAPTIIPDPVLGNMKLLFGMGMAGGFIWAEWRVCEWVAHGGRGDA